MTQPLSPLTQISSYQIQKLVGQGTFARVYIATDRSDLRQPKRALLELIVQGNAEEMQLRQRTFTRTAEILEKLNYPAIPRFYRMFEYEGKLYLVQEFIEGATYGDYLQYLDDRQSPLHISELERIFHEALVGLAELHRNRIIHRDIKPGNLMRRASDGATVIIDFGSACDLGRHSSVATHHQAAKTTIGRTRMYTPGYAHPDQRDDLTPATPQWDLYALAKTMIALRLGSDPPWSMPWSIEQLGFSLPVQMVVKEMLKSEGCRFRTADDALQMLAHLASTSPASTSSTQVPATSARIDPLKAYSAKRRLQPSFIRWLAIAMGGLIGSVVGLLLWRIQVLQGANSVAQCPLYVHNEFEYLPVPDRGIAARFYYPDTALPGDSILEVWHGDRLIAQARDDNFQGFIWISSMAENVAFPAGTYHLRLLVPESLVYTKDITLDTDFPFHYVGQVKAQPIDCVIDLSKKGGESAAEPRSHLNF